MFLRETFLKKPSLFQRKGIYSRKILFPAFGALGRISVAAASFSSARQESHVVPMEHSRDTARDTAASHQLNT